MRLLKKDVPEGFLHLKLDTLDDLWALRTLIAEGDAVTADTVRTATPAGGERVREGKMEKKPVRLTVRAETVEWHDFDDHLRVLGPITSGTDVGRHHTLVLRPDGADVQVHKRGRLQSWQLQLVAEAVAATESPQVLLLAIDDSEAQFALLKSYGLQLLGSLAAHIPGKRFAGAEDGKAKFYGETLASLRQFRRSKDVPLVVVGPGWWRDEFIAFASERDAQAVAGAISEGTSQGGRAGLQEALRRGVVERVARGHRVDVETRLVEELMERIARGNAAVAYGPADVARAVAAGAAETILASDDVVRAGTHDVLLRNAEEARARLVLVSSSHEAGERLRQMGGLAALLRFPLP